MSEMDLKSRVGASGPSIIYAPTADGRKPGRPNMVTLMADLDDKLERLSTDNEIATRKTNKNIKRLHWSVVGLVVLEIILWI